MNTHLVQKASTAVLTASCVAHILLDVVGTRAEARILFTLSTACGGMGQLAQSMCTGSRETRLEPKAAQKQ